MKIQLGGHFRFGRQERYETAVAVRVRFRKYAYMLLRSLAPSHVDEK